MITEKDLLEAIAECEGERDPTANTCLKLAAFYYLKDRYSRDGETARGERRQPPISYAYGPADIDGSRSEFAEAIRGLSANEVLRVVDDMMQSVKILLPSLYDSYMRKFKQL